MKVTINTETKTITLLGETSAQELIQFINDFGLSDWTLEGSNSYPQIWTQPYTYSINPLLDTTVGNPTVSNVMTHNCTLT